MDKQRTKCPRDGTGVAGGSLRGGRGPPPAPPCGRSMASTAGATTLGDRVGGRSSRVEARVGAARRGRCPGWRAGLRVPDELRRSSTPATSSTPRTRPTCGWSASWRCGWQRSPTAMAVASPSARTRLQAIEVVDVGPPSADIERVITDNVTHRAFVLGPVHEGAGRFRCRPSSASTGSSPTAPGPIACRSQRSVSWPPRWKVPARRWCAATGSAPRNSIAHVPVRGAARVDASDHGYRHARRRHRVLTRWAPPASGRSSLALIADRGGRHGWQRLPEENISTTTSGSNMIWLW